MDNRLPGLPPGQAPARLNQAPVANQAPGERRGAIAAQGGERAADAFNAAAPQARAADDRPQAAVALPPPPVRRRAANGPNFGNIPPEIMNLIFDAAGNGGANLAGVNRQFDALNQERHRRAAAREQRAMARQQQPRHVHFAVNPFAAREPRPDDEGAGNERVEAPAHREPMAFHDPMAIAPLNMVLPDIEAMPPLRDPMTLAAPYNALFADTRTAPQTRSVERQLRIFAAMQGPAKPYSVYPVQGAPKHYVPQLPYEGTLADHMAQHMENPNQVFALTVWDPEAFDTHWLPTQHVDLGLSAYIHGEYIVKRELPSGKGKLIPDPTPGKFLRSVAEQFSTTLSMVHARGVTDSDFRILHKLYANITDWCFNGAGNMLNDFLQYWNLAGVDVSEVPNIDSQDMPDIDKMYACATTYGLARAAQFEKATGISSRDNGDFHPDFRPYISETNFRAYLTRMEKGDVVKFPAGTLDALVAMMVEEDLITEDATPTAPAKA